MLIGFTGGVVNPSTTTDFSVPSGAEIGDHLLFIYGARRAATVPSGWTHLQNAYQPPSGGTRLTMGSAYLELVSSPPSVVTVSAAISNGYGVLCLLRGVTGFEKGPQNDEASGNPTALSMTASEGGLLIAHTASTRTDGAPFTEPSGMTLLATGFGGSGTLGAALGTAYKTVSAGPTGDQTFTAGGWGQEKGSTQIMVYGGASVSAEPFLLRHNPRTNKVIPVLSSPTVTDIGAACVRPRVTKGF